MVRSTLTAFHRQATACCKLGSPFTYKLLTTLTEHLSASTMVGDRLLNWPGDPIEDALALRVAGALHALVLTGAAPELAALYPPHQQTSDQNLGHVIAKILDQHDQDILQFIESPPQTNEVARSAALALGFITIAKRTSLPLALLEIGASAGLNLHWDSFHYDLGGQLIGNADSRPKLTPDWHGPPPPVADVIVKERRGCDLSPIDLRSQSETLRLRAYVWPDQADRRNRLDQALKTTQMSAVAIDEAKATDWTKKQLAHRRDGVATVVFHSIVWQYIPGDDRVELEAIILAAGQRAGRKAPFAWLRMEPKSPKAAALDLTLWPGGKTERLAEVDYHGRWIHWLYQAS